MTQSIGSFARNIIATRSELSNAQVLELVRAQFPSAKTSVACIAWYKSNMKKTGYKVEKIVVERTLEIIQAELEDAQMRVELLQEELNDKKEEQAEDIKAKFEYYKALMEKQA
jgi:hypothetical protein